MIERALAAEVLERALSTGADFAEIFLEDSSRSSMNLIEGCIDTALSGRSVGAGVRIFSGTRSVYAYSNGIDRAALLAVADSVAQTLTGTRTEDMVLGGSVCANAHPVQLLPSAIPGARKVQKLRESYEAAKAYDANITQASASYADVDQRVCIINNQGLFVEDRRIRTRVMVHAVASEGGVNQTGYVGPGASMGFEFMEQLDMNALGKEAARIATTMLRAEPCPAGVLPVVIEGAFGGVIFHEACGHALEATSVSKGSSVFCDKVGQMIASSCVTAIDDGTIPNAWGSLNIDDEGMATRRNVLIENGVLKGYMIDLLGGRRMQMSPTGSGRRQSYMFAPTSRMTNTFIDAGHDDENEMIASLGEGLYAAAMGGGSVNPVTGEFNFSVMEGYLIKNGKIDRPVRGATLIGKGAEVLLRIDRVGKQLSHGQGMCGSVSGLIPTNVGQPRLRVSSMTIGGQS